MSCTEQNRSQPQQIRAGFLGSNGSLLMVTLAGTKTCLSLLWNAAPWKARRIGKFRCGSANRSSALDRTVGQGGTSSPISRACCPGAAWASCPNTKYLLSLRIFALNALGVQARWVCLPIRGQRNTLSYDGHFWRRMAKAGATYAPRPFARWAPSVIGLFFAALLPDARAAVLANQRRMFGRRSFWVEQWEVLMTFVEFAHCFSEGLGASRKEGRNTRVEVLHDRAFLDVIESGKGVVVVTAHAGPWDGAASDLALGSDRPVLLVMNQEGDEEAARVQDDARSGVGVDVVRLGKDPLSALPVLTHLLDGGVAALQLDRAPPGRPARVSHLFGQPFAVPTGPFLLAGLAQVPVVPVFMVRRGFYQREVHVGDPIWPKHRARGEEFDEYIRQALLQMERHLRSFPRQWFHFVSPAVDHQRLQELGSEQISGRHSDQRSVSEAAPLREEGAS